MGRVARTKSHTTRNCPGWLSCLVALVVICFMTATALSQSGRRQEPGKGGKPPTGPIAEPNRPGNPSSSNRPAKSTSDEIDAADVVKISSSLVPIPASVVDRRGNAIVNLNLDDFELRVDGDLRPLSDLTR